MREKEADLEIPKNVPGEETKVEFEGGKEIGMKTLRNDLPGLDRRIKELETEGWKVFKRGPLFVVMDRTQEDKKEPTYH